MRLLMIVLATMISFSSVIAQISFEATKMVTVRENGKDVDNINCTITINSDTTEIYVDLKSSKIKESIGELYTSFEDGDYKILIYNLNNEELLLLHFNSDVLFSVVFQTDSKNKLEFEL